MTMMQIAENLLRETLKHAILSGETPEPLYRYALERRWDVDRPVLYACMVNPSKANHLIDDPTIIRLCQFARRWGYGGIFVINLFALRSSDPKELDTAPDPLGPDNDKWHQKLIRTAAYYKRPILVAWGNNGRRSRPDGASSDVRFCVLAQGAGVELLCLDVTKDGFPKHPLARGKHRVPDDFTPIPFTLRIDH